MAMTLLSRLADGAPVPVFPCIGAGGIGAAERMGAAPGVRFVDTPRQAAILLVLGRVPAWAQGALDRIHDQLTHPRRALRQKDDGDAVTPGMLRAAWTDLVAGRGEDAPDRLPDRPPNEWRGMGDHGQGGKGMMGGVPYGRPMAMTDEDLRDGLALDAYSFSIGPFAPMLPPGMVLELTLQGDVIVTAKIARPPFEQREVDLAPQANARRMLRLMGHSGWLGRRIAPRILPRGLAPLAGTCARLRLESWLRGEPVPTMHPAADLLVGLEWQEAMLAIASFPPEAWKGEAAR